MKEFYGDSVLYKELNNTEDKIEFFDTEDTLSARTLNRPIRELKEELDRVKLELANLDKKIYGRVQPESSHYASIASGIFEEFTDENIGSGSLRSGKTYLRIPTGVINCYYKNPNNDPNNDPNALWGWGGHVGFQRVQNYPKFELFERELADCYNIDLHTSFNDIKVGYDIKNSKICYNIKVKTAKEFIDDSSSNEGTINCIEDETTYGENNDINNVFDAVSVMNNHYDNYLSKNTDDFSLEETIDLEGVNTTAPYYIYITPKSGAPRFFDDNDVVINYDTAVSSINDGHGVFRYSKNKKFFIYQIINDNNFNIKKVEAICLYENKQQEYETETVEYKLKINPKIDVEKEELDNIEVLNAAIGTAWCNSLSSLKINTNNLYFNKGEDKSFAPDSVPAKTINGEFYVENLNGKIRFLKLKEGTTYTDASLAEILATFANDSNP